MKKFIIKILILIAPLVLILCFILTIAVKNHQFKPNNMYYFKEFERAFQIGDFDVVAIGNSKLLSALDKRTLEENNKNSVAILGYSSANISVSKLTLESYLNNCSTKPKFVLLEVSWFTFNNQRTHFHGIVGDLFIKDFRLWENYFNYKSELLFPIIKEAFKASLKKSVELEPSKDEITSYAVRFRDSSPQSLDYKFNVDEFEVVFPEHLAGIDKLLLRDFYSIINLCKKENIDLILFTAPEDEEYSKCQKDIKDIKEIYKSTSSINPNIYFLDYTLGGELYNKKFEKWLANSHHINENVLFTKELLKDIKIRTDKTLYK